MLNPKDLTAGTEARIESLLNLANTAIASAERLAALNLNTSRALLEENLAAAKALLAAKDQKELASIQAGLLQPAVEKAVAYSRAVYEISTSTEAEVSKLVTTGVAEVQKNMADVVSKVGGSSPAGAEVAVETLKRTLDAANTAFTTLNQAAQQVKQMAEANFNTAAEASVKAAGEAAKVALRAVKI